MTFDLNKLTRMTVEHTDGRMIVYGHECLTEEEKAYFIAFYAQRGVYPNTEIIWATNESHKGA